MDLYEARLKQVVRNSETRLRGVLDRVPNPYLKTEMERWLNRYLSGKSLYRAFVHPDSYPMMLFPWYAEKRRRPPDIALQTDLGFSTMSGYLAVRMMDNIMDGHATIEAEVLPLLNVFFAEFQQTFYHYFSPDHPFWQRFRTYWYASASDTIKDAKVTAIDETHFISTTAQKTGAVKIPLTVVGYRTNSEADTEKWCTFADLFGCWHQFYNDVFDWRKDAENGTCTFFLSEARRQGAEENQIPVWVIEQGFDWAKQRLDSWMSELETLGREIGSPDISAYLDFRRSAFDTKFTEIKKGFDEAKKLMDILHTAQEG